MFNSKKTVALCATIVASFSTLGGLSQVAFADSSKSGNTVVTLDAVPQPVEWGLSVPASLTLDKTYSASDGTILAYDSNQISITKEDGTNFKDDGQDRSFKVGFTSEFESNGYMRIKNANTESSITLTGIVHRQGFEYPEHSDNNVIVNSAGIENVANALSFESKADGSNEKMTKTIEFYVAKNKADNINTNGAGLRNTISWTATE